MFGGRDGGGKVLAFIEGVAVEVGCGLLLKN
jgi:hypothetical protein